MPSANVGQVIFELINVVAAQTVGFKTRAESGQTVDENKGKIRRAETRKSEAE